LENVSRAALQFYTKVCVSLADATDAAAAAAAQQQPPQQLQQPPQHSSSSITAVGTSAPPLCTLVDHCQVGLAVGIV
jgi:hypothetical protein